MYGAYSMFTYWPDNGSFQVHHEFSVQAISAFISGNNPQMTFLHSATFKESVSQLNGT